MNMNMNMNIDQSNNLQSNFNSKLYSTRLLDSSIGMYLFVFVIICYIYLYL